TVQAQILELLLELQKQDGSAVLFINHNLNLIAQYADRLAVMYAGRIVETAAVKTFFEKPAHPYSQGLLKALPNLETKGSDLLPIPGQVPKPVDFAEGCRFRDRCSQALETCDQKPTAYMVGDEHFVNCFLYDKGSK
ncbi:MAG: ABC transporter ATP-binding protein, partial [Proteobacteria bacterium]|nr:ABC transporter ATP-binding protein [Pseudomonadota bacterium]